MKQNTSEEMLFFIRLAIQNNSIVEFKTDKIKISSGKEMAFNDIPANAMEENALYAIGTSGTWTGLVGYASWSYSFPGAAEAATLTLDFDMPFDGRNSASLTGNATFNKHFTINPNIVMPGYGQEASINATINSK